MRITTFILAAIIVFSSSLRSQSNNVEVEKLLLRVNALEQLTTKLNQQSISNSNQIQEYNSKLIKAYDSIATLKREILNLQSNMHNVTNKLGIEIKQAAENATGEINNLGENVTKNTIYWILSFLFGVSLTVFGFVMLRKQSNKDKTNLAEQIKNTSDVLRDEQLKLDDQLLKLLETQMKLMDEQRKTIPSQSDEIDHSLALKVADEIIRIKKNLMHMDPATKGLKQLAAAVKRIKDNFEAKEYDIVDMFNKPYHEGMKVTANFRLDENLSKGEQIITNIIKPQVNFRGVMIQSAQIEVSCGEE